MRVVAVTCWSPLWAKAGANRTVPPANDHLSRVDTTDGLAHSRPLQGSAGTGYVSVATTCFSDDTFHSRWNAIYEEVA